MNSLQSRLILGSAGVFAVGFLIAGIAVYGFSQSTMYAEFDEALRATVLALATLTEETEDGVHFQFTEDFEEFTQKDRPSYYQVWLDGKVLARSPRLSKGDLLFGGYGSPLRPDYAPTTLPDGRSGRQAIITFQPKANFDDQDDDDREYDDDDPGRSEQQLWNVTGIPTKAGNPSFTSREDFVSASSSESSHSPTESGIFTLTWERPEHRVTIAVARDTTDIEQRLASLRWILAFVGVGITALSSCLLVLVVRQGLKPVQSVARAIAGIDASSLDDRVPTGEVPSEIAPLVTRLNDLLGRLEDAFYRERAFSSNLAHELRTPLAGLKSTLEVYLSRLHDPEEYQEAMTACLQICDQSQNLVENLLSLAQVEGKTLRCHYEPVQVDDLFHECWQPLSAEALAKDLQTNFDLSPQVIKTDREMLRVILRNVLSNAVCYSDRGGMIEAAIVNGGGTVSVNVGNTGHNMTGEQAGQVFDRLWRGDRARGQTGEHFGLGLTLAKRFTEALGGNVRVSIDEMFRIRISLPVRCGQQL